MDGEGLGPAVLSAIYENGPDGILFTSPDGTILSANPAACQILRMTERRIRELGRQGLADPGDERWARLLEERARTGHVAGVARMLCGDGGYVEIEMTARLITTSDGALHSVTFLRDVSERVALEKKLSESEESHRMTLDALAEVVILYRVSGERMVPILLNRAGAEFLGMDLATFALAIEGAGTDVYREDGSRVAPADSPAATAIRTRRVVAGVVFGMDQSDGTTRWMRTTATPILSPEGEVTMVVTSASDVTEERAAAKALELAHDRFAALVEHGSDLIVITGADRTLRYASPSFQRILGRDPAAHLGRPVWELVHLDDRDRLGQIFADLRTRPGASARFECRLARADGTFRHFVVTQTNLLEDPSIEGFVGNATDITERVEMERQLTFDATHDLLTGLPNRALFHDRLELAQSRSRRVGRPFGVFFVDLDGFKSVNDDHGHQVGDELLRQVAQRLVEAARGIDTVARLGGDEFIVLAEEIDEGEAQGLAARLRALFDEPFLIEEFVISVGASVGVAMCRDDGDLDALVEEADRNMYKAKLERRGV